MCYDKDRKCTCIGGSSSIVDDDLVLRACNWLLMTYQTHQSGHIQARSHLRHALSIVCFNTKVLPKR